MKVAICVCIKNEEKELPYWIAWYSSLGVDSFIIYDDNSRDSTREVIKSLSNTYDIRFFRNFENKDRSVIRQCRAYNHAIEKYKDEFDWIGFFDSDEYLDLYGKEIKDFLKDNEASDCIAFNWCCFGSNGHISRPYGPPIFNYQKHGEQNLKWNKHTKVIVRPKQLKGPIYQVHNFLVFGKTTLNNGDIPEWTNEHGGFTSKDANWDNARLLHFQSRSLEHYVNKHKFIDDVRKKTTDPLQVVTKNGEYESVRLEINSKYLHNFVNEMWKLSEGQKKYFIHKLKNENESIIFYMINKFSKDEEDIFKPERIFNKHELSNGWISFHEFPGNILNQYFSSEDQDFIVFTMKNHFNDTLAIKNNQLVAIDSEDSNLYGLYIKGSNYIHLFEKNMDCIYIDGDYTFSKVLTFKVWGNANGTFSISNSKDGKYLGFNDKKEIIFSKLRALSWEQISVSNLIVTGTNIDPYIETFRNCSSINYILNNINDYKIMFLFFNLIKMLKDKEVETISFLMDGILNEHIF